MAERFIERGTSYHLRNATLSIYETNCACKDIKFHFGQFVLTLMLTGHKTILTDKLRFEFFPGTFFIPEKETIIDVSIPNASLENPTKCLVLEIQPAFIKSFYEEISSSESDGGVLYRGEIETSKDYFFSSNQLLINAFVKLYGLQFDDPSPAKPFVEDLFIKEILLRVFQTEGLYLLIENFRDNTKSDKIRKVTSYIANNLSEKLTVSKLSKIAGMGQTSFFNKFKSATGYSPNEYILHERINHAKVLIRMNKFSLKEIAYQCGFNSYEYFSSSFKKIEKKKPSDFRRINYTSGEPLPISRVHS